MKTSFNRLAGGLLSAGLLFAVACDPATPAAQPTAKPAAQPTAKPAAQATTAPAAKTTGSPAAKAASPSPAAKAATAAEGVYKIGWSGLQTGPNAGTYAPSQDGFNAYIERLNARGGIDGRRVEVTYLDNRGEPPRAVADTRRLLDEEQVLLLMNNAPSSTYAPMTQAATESRTPLLFAGSAVCPQEVFPPNPDPWLFCASFNMLQPDATAIVRALEELNQQFGGGGQMEVALAAMDIPVSRQGVDLIEAAAGQAGMQVTEKIASPPGTADYAPFATRIINTGATWVTHWAPFDVGTGLFTALTRQGWEGYYLATASPLAEVDTERFAQPNFLVIPTYAFTVDGLPVFAEIEAALATYGASYPPSGASLGWVAGLTVEQALTRCGWPCDRQKLRDSMEGVDVDTQGLYGGPIDWSATNHVRSAAFYKVYRWDAAQNRIVQVRDWERVEIR